MNLRQIFTNYSLFEIFILGIVSGMPFSILYSTLSAWFQESGIALSIITTFAVAKMSYSLKFVWAPVIDFFRVPGLGIFGHRKSWMLLSVICNCVVLYFMGLLDPKQDLALFYPLTIAFGFFGSIYDISFDAFRIEKIAKELQGIASANTVLGYRIGMAFTGAGAFMVAEYTNSWNTTFMFMAGLFLLATIVIVCVKEKELEREKISSYDLLSLSKLLINPFKDFLSREGALLILLGVVFFKMGDAMLGVVSTPFYLKLGYNKSEIATIAKLYGIISTIAGVYAGGFLVWRLGQFKGLIITGILQSITNFIFVWLNHQPPSFEALFVAITIENFASGMGSAALVAYLGIVCNQKYSATQFALLSSAAALCNNTITVFGGKLVEIMGWDWYFTMTVFLGLPAVLVFAYLNCRFGVTKGSNFGQT